MFCNSCPCLEWGSNNIFILGDVVGSLGDRSILQYFCHGQSVWLLLFSCRRHPRISLIYRRVAIHTTIFLALGRCLGGKSTSDYFNWVGEKRLSIVVSGVGEFAKQGKYFSFLSTSKCSYSWSLELTQAEHFSSCIHALYTVEPSIKLLICKE